MQQLAEMYFIGEARRLTKRIHPPGKCLQKMLCPPARREQKHPSSRDRVASRYIAPARPQSSKHLLHSRLRTFNDQPDGIQPQSRRIDRQPCVLELLGCQLDLFGTHVIVELF